MKQGALERLLHFDTSLIRSQPHQTLGSAGARSPSPGAPSKRRRDRQRQPSESLLPKGCGRAARLSSPSPKAATEIERRTLLLPVTHRRLRVRCMIGRPDPPFCSRDPPFCSRDPPFCSRREGLDPGSFGGWGQGDGRPLSGKDLRQVAPAAPPLEPFEGRACDRNPESDHHLSQNAVQ